MIRNSRRSSLLGSSISLSSRRSSSNLKDIERIQAILQRKKDWSPRFIVFIIFCSPLFVFLYNSIVNEYDGHLIQFVENLSKNSSIFITVLPSPWSPVAWRVLSFIALMQLFFYLILPKKTIIISDGSGCESKREVNTFPSCLLVVLFFIMGSTLGFYRATIFYSNWISIISLLNIVSLLITFILYVRRQTSDFFNINISDFYYGTELTPTILDIDIKHFVTYRISFTLWAIYIISAYHYSKSIRGQISLELIACAILQLIYIARTLWFEHFHYSQLDAQVDKAGFCRIWRGMVLLPTLYVTPISLLARNQSVLPKPLSVLLFLMGLTAIYVNTDINQQRYNFRIGNGNVKIWGKDPFFIAAKFRRENGDFGTNLLLGSGWWGLSRHPNYLAEWLSFMFWSLLQGSTTIIPYSPLIYLAIFLYLRTVHDEIRCLGKYGNYWLQHSNRVNFMLIPSIY